MDTDDLDRSLERWLIAGIFVLVALIAAFPAYKAVESARRDDALARRQSALLLAGQKLWTDNCSACHGVQGEGPAAPALRSREFLSQTPDRLIHHVIQAGVPGTAMSAWWNEFGGPLTDDQIAALVAFLRNWEDDAPSISDWREPGASTASPAPSEPPVADAATITIDDTGCSPKSLRVAAGGPFSLVVANRASSPATVSLVDFHVRIETGAGEDVTEELTPLDPGRYRFECIDASGDVLEVGEILAGRLSGVP